MTQKVKILFLAADPLNTSYRPRLGKELREIEDHIQISPYRNSFEIISRWAIRQTDLMKVLAASRPDIVHLTGHGNPEGVVLENNFGKMKLIKKQILADIFRAHKQTIRIIFFNICYSTTYVDAFRDEIDFIVAMEKMIGDQTAIPFAASFYQHLAFGYSIEQAFNMAKVELKARSIREFKNPKLFVRPGANASEPFLVNNNRHTKIYIFED